MKERIRALLEQNRGEYISGSEIAAQFGVSRTAVWKAVQSLQAEGADISAVPHKGYCLAQTSDVLSESDIKSHLRTKELGRNIHVLKTVDSTSNYLSARLAELPAGTLAISDHQTGGKGRMGRSFYSPAGCGLYMSLLLRPQVLAQDATQITSCAAVAVAQAIQSVCGVDARIKWVNDVVYRHKKLCGILTEGTIQMETGYFSYLILGIGVNIMPPEGGYPPEIADVATALSLCGPKRTYTRNRLAAEILNYLEPLCIPSLKTEAFMPVYKRLSSVLGQPIMVLNPAKPLAVPMEAIDISGEGHLIARDEEGTVHTLVSGEISVRVR